MRCRGGTAPRGTSLGGLRTGCALVVSVLVVFLASLLALRVGATEAG
jgi:hypothetical protein